MPRWEAWGLDMVRWRTKWLWTGMVAAALICMPALHAQEDTAEVAAEALGAQQTQPGHLKLPQPAPPARGCGARTISEKAIFKNLFCDQKGIWTGPFHKHNLRSKTIPFLAATGALIATDKYVMQELNRHEPGTFFDVSRQISNLGKAEGTFAFSGAMYLAGLVSGNRRLRETALLSVEAQTDAEIVKQLTKIAFMRERPTRNNGLTPINDSRGRFWAGFNGTFAFPSGHSVNDWALATVFARRYNEKRWIRYTAYGVATVVSVARIFAREHFPGDVLAGSAIGFYIGRYVVDVHK